MTRKDRTHKQLKNADATCRIRTGSSTKETSRVKRGTNRTCGEWEKSHGPLDAFWNRNLVGGNMSRGWLPGGEKSTHLFQIKLLWLEEEEQSERSDGWEKGGGAKSWVRSSSGCSKERRCRNRETSGGGRFWKKTRGPRPSVTSWFIPFEGTQQSAGVSS